MGWREVILQTLEQTGHARYRPSNAVEMLEADIGKALLSMPAADRIAMARELLAGTEYDAVGRVAAHFEPALDRTLVVKERDL